MLYTSMPLERIYHNYEMDGTEKIIELENGRIVACLVDDHYEVNRLQTTDLSEYLNEAYMPGATIKF